MTFYNPSQIKIIDDAISLIRRRPEMFVGEGDVRPAFLVAALAQDVLALGARQIEIHRTHEWWIVASDEDWLAYDNNLDVREIFHRILPAPDRVNGYRSEVVIHALAGAVFTSKATDLVVFSGDDAEIRHLLTREPFVRFSQKRIVGFTMTPSKHTAHRRDGDQDSN